MSAVYLEYLMLKRSNLLLYYYHALLPSLLCSPTLLQLYDQYERDPWQKVLQAPCVNAHSNAQTGIDIACSFR